MNRRYHIHLPLFAALLPLLFLLPGIATAQDYSDTIERTLQFAQDGHPANELIIHNIHGNVTVEGYDGDTIRITARQQLDGTDAEIEQARRELKLVTEAEGERAYVYIDGPFITFRKNDSKKYNYRMDNWDNDYDFRYDITIRVPKETHIHASTINRGSVSVRNTTRRIDASNVNGKVTLWDIAGPTQARTVNGDIDIRYTRSPDEDSEYKTVNGTIEVQYPADLSADVRFKSMHGELYTDFQNIQRLNARVNTDTKKANGGVRYKVDRSSPIRIGNGGPLFNFEVLNGNVYIKQIQ